MVEREYTYTIEKPEKKFSLFPIVLLLVLQILEALLTLFFTRVIPQTNELFYSLIWLLPKIIILVAIIVIYFSKVFVEDARIVQKNFKKFLVFAIVSFLVFYLFQISAAYYQELMDSLMEIGETTNQETIYDFIKSSNKIIHYVLLGLNIVVVAPLLEEFEFRKLVFDAFPNCHFIIPVLSSGLLFGLAHVANFSLQELIYFPIYFLPGICFAGIYHYSNKNIYATFFVHMAINLISFIAIMTNLESL